MASIEIQRRDVGYVDRLRAYKVLIDDEHRGTIGRGQTLTLDVAPGRHTVMLKIDWARSQKLNVDVGDGETARLRCAPAANPLTGLWYSTIGRGRYIRLRVAPTPTR